MWTGGLEDGGWGLGDVKGSGMMASGHGNKSVSKLHVVRVAQPKNV